MAQSFTTGASQYDFTLARIQLHLEADQEGASADPAFTYVRILEDADGRPGAVHASLSNPAAFRRGAPNSFAAPAGTRLEENTTYWVVVNEGAARDTELYVGRTRSAGEDAGSRADWSLGDQHLWKRDSTTTTWQVSSLYALRLRVRGSANDADDNRPAAGAPTISGRAQVGVALTAETSGITDPDGLTSPTFTYQWIRVDADGAANATDIPNATDATYTPVAADRGRKLKVRVTFADDNRHTETLTSAAHPAGADTVLRANAPATGAPAIAGAGRVGAELTAQAGDLADADGLPADGFPAGYGFQWVRVDADGSSNAEDIAGATQRAYTPAPADVGRRLRVRVSFTDRAGNAEARTSAAHPADRTVVPVNSPATGAPGVSGRAQVGESLTAEAGDLADGNGLPAGAFPAGYGFQWIGVDADGASNAADIAGATGRTYTATAADEGRRVRVRVSFADAHGYAEARTSAAHPATGTILPVNRPAAGAPTVAGTATVGETLTAATAAITDADGLTGAVYAYQWIRVDADGAANPTAIPGAQASTYALTVLDAGKRVRVRVAFLDDNGNAEALTGAAFPASGTVAASPHSIVPGRHACLVSNVGQAAGATDIVGAFGADRTVQAQAFSTGAGVGGYALGSVRIPIADFDGTDAVRVAVHAADGSGDPGERLFALANPGTIADDAFNTFTAPPATVLKRSTTYFVVVEAPAGTFGVGDTAADGEDACTSDGWGLADGLRSRFSAAGDWTIDPAALRIAVRGAGAEDSAATGAPAIAGTAAIGEELTASLGTIADANGLPAGTFPAGYELQWISGDADDFSNPVEIAFANGETHRLTEAEDGRRVKVRVSFVDSGGVAETRESGPFPASGSVERANAAPTAAAGAVTTDEDTAHRFATSEFGFADTDPLDALASVKVTALPAAGRGVLRLNGTDIAAADLPQTVTAAALAGGNFRYVPPANANGAAYASFMFRVNDGRADSAAAYAMTVHVTAVNDAPTVAAPIPDQAATVGVAFDYAFPAGTFADVDAGEVLRYSASLGNGGTLPSWLGFTAASRRFAGTPEAADTGTVTVRVTATDGGGASVRDTFDIRVGANAAPSASNRTVATDEDTAHRFAAGEFGFTDPDAGNRLASVKATSLPAAGRGVLRLNGADIAAADLPRTVTAAELAGGSFRYVPPANANGAAYAGFLFRVNDGRADSALAYRMTVNVTAVNDAPTVATAIPDQTATAGVAFGYTVPAGTFSDVDAGDTLGYSASLGDGGDLPSWLGFTAASRRFAGTPQEAHAGTVAVRVTATDSGGASASDTFDIEVSGPGNSAATGRPTIAGTAVAGRTLTAGAGDIADADGLPTTAFPTGYSFQWIRVGADGAANPASITGATARTYQLRDADVGRRLKVRVGFADGDGNAEARTSDAYRPAAPSRRRTPRPSPPTGWRRWRRTPPTRSRPPTSSSTTRMLTTCWRRSRSRGCRPGGSSGLPATRSPLRRRR